MSEHYDNPLAPPEKGQAAAAAEAARVTAVCAQIMKEIEPLSTDDKIRVIRSVAALFDITVDI